MSHSSCILLFFALLFSCNPANEQQKAQMEEQQPAEQPQTFKKRPGISADTIWLNTPSAVFFYPDSIQKEGYRAFIPASFESSEHEYLFQINNARSRLKANWEQVQLVDCKNAKYLIAEGMGEPVNLDEINEPWGLILFEKGKAPALVDMMNIDTELETYFIRNRE
ncbi:MAG: hypothetical protein ACYC1Q_14395 [Bacteroidia bacterium]